MVRQATVVSGLVLLNLIRVAAAQDTAPEPLPSVDGSAGLYHVGTAETGSPHHLRLGLHGEYARGSDLVVDGDRDLRLRGVLALGYTPVRFLEVFAALYGASNRNQRATEPDRADPETIRSLGDLVVGSKFARPLSRGFHAGAELSLRFLSAVTGGGFEPGATSVWMGALGGFDLREVSDVPLRFHLGGGFYLDNSTHLQDLSHLPGGSQAVSSFAYGLARDRIRTVFALDVPSRASAGFSLQPLLEYHVDFVTAPADAAPPGYRAGLCAAGVTAIDRRACRDNRDQMSVTFALRARTAGGLTVDVGIDVGLRSPGVAYGPVQAPYNVVLGMAYPLDLASLAPPRG